MVMQLDNVVPFGRSLDEYVKMFALSDADRGRSILGVGDGPASFNAEATRQGTRITSVDPIYDFTGAEILHRFYQVVDGIIDQVKATPDDWVWSYHGSPDQLKHNRIRVIETFVEDYELGKSQGRYVTGALPHLDFADRTFDLALCSHFLFLYSEHYDVEFHRASILEMLRVSREVRIFPVLTLMLNRSPHLDPILKDCRDRGYTVKLERVSYELQRGGNEMVVITSPTE